MAKVRLVWVCLLEVGPSFGRELPHGRDKGLGLFLGKELGCGVERGKEDAECCGQQGLVSGADERRTQFFCCLFLLNHYYYYVAEPPAMDGYKSSMAIGDSSSSIHVDENNRYGTGNKYI